MIEVEILDYEDYNPSTVTVAGYLNTTIDIVNVSRYLPVNHIFDKDTGERVKLQSGSRQRISYFGIEGVFISICYKKVKRGMRTGAMNNMVSLDIQWGEKNIHLKLSSSSITSVGTKTIEDGQSVFDVVIDHIVQLQEMILFLKKVALDEDKMDRYIDWFIDNTYDEEIGLVRESQFLQNLEESNVSDEMEKVVRCFGKYINDFDYDEQRELIQKIREMLDINRIYSGDPETGLECQNVTIYNSVYHITPIKMKDKGFRMPLHQLAPFLAQIGLRVEFHNWSSEGVTVCIDAEEEKKGADHSNKEYKHRFIIHETSKVRQCSPTLKREAYKNYVGLMKLIQKFFECDDVPFEKYIYRKSEKEDKKLSKMIGKLGI